MITIRITLKVLSALLTLRLSEYSLGIRLECSWFFVCSSCVVRCFINDEVVPFIVASNTPVVE